MQKTLLVCVAIYLRFVRLISESEVTGWVL